MPTLKAIVESVGGSICWQIPVVTPIPGMLCEVPVGIQSLAPYALQTKGPFKAQWMFVFEFSVT